MPINRLENSAPEFQRGLICGTSLAHKPSYTVGCWSYGCSDPRPKSRSSIEAPDITPQSSLSEVPHKKPPEHNPSSHSEAFRLHDLYLLPTSKTVSVRENMHGARDTNGQPMFSDIKLALAILSLHFAKNKQTVL